MHLWVDDDDAANAINRFASHLSVPLDDMYRRAGCPRCRIDREGELSLPCLFFYISQAIHLTAAILLNVIIIIIKVRCRPIGLTRCGQCCPCLDE